MIMFQFTAELAEVDVKDRHVDVLPLGDTRHLKWTAHDEKMQYVVKCAGINDLDQYIVQGQVAVAENKGEEIFHF